MRRSTAATNQPKTRHQKMEHDRSASCNRSEQWLHLSQTSLCSWLAGLFAVGVVDLSVDQVGFDADVELVQVVIDRRRRRIRGAAVLRRTAWRLRGWLRRSVVAEANNATTPSALSCARPQGRGLRRDHRKQRKHSTTATPLRREVGTEAKADIEIKIAGYRAALADVTNRRTKFVVLVGAWCWPSNRQVGRTP